MGDTTADSSSQGSLHEVGRVERALRSMMTTTHDDRDRVKYKQVVVCTSVLREDTWVGRVAVLSQSEQPPPQSQPLFLLLPFLSRSKQFSVYCNLFIEINSE
jgi:hypothetical protein